MSQIDRVPGCCEASGGSPVEHRGATPVALLFAAAWCGDAALPRCAPAAFWRTLGPL